MDEQGVEAAWLFPSQGVCMEGPMQPDIEASIHILRAFNRWLDDDWGFAYQDRIFGAPFLTLSDVDQAVDGARLVRWSTAPASISIRNGPVFTPDGTKSPADPTFDPFWARVAEARVVVAPHAGFEDGYVKVDPSASPRNGAASATRRPATSIDQYSTVVTMLMKHRLVHDFAGILVADKLFERHPGLRVAYIENGGTWVGDLLHGLQVLHGQNPGMFQTQPGRPVPRALLGRAVRRGQRPGARAAPPGRAHPLRFRLAARRRPGPSSATSSQNVASFSLDDQRKIMVDNARALTLT